jgi:DNA-binding MarR family transcriptional regulator
MARGATTTPVHDIERALFRIFRGSQGTRLHRLASRAAGVELDRAGFGALVALGDEHMRLSDLATRQGLDISTVSRRVAQLEAGGLVERTADPADRRASVVSLTERGREVVASISELRRELLESVVADWPERDRREFARLLGRFAEDMSLFRSER